MRISSSEPIQNSMLTSSHLKHPPPTYLLLPKTLLPIPICPLINPRVQQRRNRRSIYSSQNRSRTELLSAHRGKVTRRWRPGGAGRARRAPPGPAAGSSRSWAGSAASPGLARPSSAPRGRGASPGCGTPPASASPTRRSSTLHRPKPQPPPPPPPHSRRCSPLPLGGFFRGRRNLVSLF